MPVSPESEDGRIVKTFRVENATCYISDAAYGDQTPVQREITKKNIARTVQRILCESIKGNTEKV